MIVPCFGLHQQPDDTLVFLHEEAGGRCLVPGAAALPSPFEVMQQPRRVRCPHEWGDPLDEPAIFHPFVQAMGPDQTGGLYFVDPEHVDWVHRLARMIPVREPIVEILWFQPIKTIGSRVGPRLTVTNAAPMCLVEGTYGEFGYLEQLTRLPRTRNLVISSQLAPPGAVRLTPCGLDPSHDWPAEGRRQLHSLVRRKMQLWT